MNWPDDFVNKIICGDCLEVMKEMPDKCVDMCMTSPPYWGLRDYGTEQIFGGDADCEHEWGIDLIQKQGGAAAGSTAQVGNQKKKIQGTHINQGNICLKCNAWKGQLGLEPTPELYIEHMAEIFHEVKRILKKRGTLWLNIGDTYWSAKGSCFNPGGNENALEAERKKAGAIPLNRGNKSDVPNLPPKCLAMIPERLAWSLIQDGWILRNKIVWYKPNAMPSSVKDRFSNKWEYIFLFSKNRKYYFDLDEVREPHVQYEVDRRKKEYLKNLDSKYEIKAEKAVGKLGSTSSIKSSKNKQKLYLFSKGKNPGDVFEIKEKLSIRDNCPGCGEPLSKHSMGQKNPSYNASMSIKTAYYTQEGIPVKLCNSNGPNPGDFWSIPTQPFPEAHFAVFPEKLCDKPIKAGSPEGGIILDPFCGAGTALKVANYMRRNFIGIEINPDYCKIAEERLAQGVL